MKKEKPKTDRGSTFVAPECSCRTGSVCQRPACCYFGAAVPREPHESLDAMPVPVCDQRQLQHLRWMVLDALRHASHLAGRAQEATEGTDATLLFNNVRQAISRFQENDPAMQALASAAISRSR